jgi:hypothetical protein
MKQLKKAVDSASVHLPLVQVFSLLLEPELDRPPSPVPVPAVVPPQAARASAAPAAVTTIPMRIRVDAMGP